MPNAGIDRLTLVDASLAAAPRQSASRIPAGIPSVFASVLLSKYVVARSLGSSTACGFHVRFPLVPFTKYNA